MRSTSIPVMALIAAAFAATAGCSDRELTYPFYGLDYDTDSDTSTDSEPGTDGDADADADADTEACPDDYVDDLGRCIRYVDWQAEETECGTSWDGAFTDLQEGIDAAWAAAQLLGSCEVWVADGTYRSFAGEPTDTFYLRSDVQVYGGFAGDEAFLEERDPGAHETVLSGEDPLALARSYHVLMGAERAALDGFTITGGDARGPSPHHRGGGIYVNASDTVIRNCVFRGNRAADGGAAFLYDGQPVVDRCTFTDNAAERGGALYVLNGEAVLTDVDIRGNTAAVAGGGVYLESVFGNCHPAFAASRIAGNLSYHDGGGVFVDNCHPAFAATAIDGNLAQRNGGGVAGARGGLELAGSTVRRNLAYGSGGGAYSDDTALALTASAVVENRAGEHGGGLRLAWSDSAVETTLVAANTAGGDGGGIFVELDFVSVERSLITGNTAARGGGVFNGERAVVSYVNSVFHGNRAATAGGAYNACLSEVELHNDILWGDAGGEIVDEKGSETVVAYCDVEGGYPAGWAFCADPLFAAPGWFADPGTPDDPGDDEWTYGDYHLLAGSPCIDNAADDLSTDADADGHDWVDIADAGMPDVAADVGAYDYQI